MTDYAEQLRRYNRAGHVQYEWFEEAAAYIEDLEERLKAATDDAKEAEAYVEELEAKLAKAVEGLQHYACSCVTPCEQLNGSCGDVARKALAELTGGRDE